MVISTESPILLLQTFTVAEPAWLKYLQFHFLTHHGSEPMCALNDVLVFGKSAAEDLEDQLSDEALLTDAQDSGDAKASEAAAPINANGNTDSQAAQASTPSSAQQVAVEAKADASSNAGLLNASGVTQAGNVSGSGKQAHAQQQASSNSTAGPRQPGENILAIDLATVRTFGRKKCMSAALPAAAAGQAENICQCKLHGLCLCLLLSALSAHGCNRYTQDRPATCYILL